MKRVFAVVTVVMALFAFSVVASATVVPDAIWANGTLFGTVVTPTSLPNQGPFEPIYNFAGAQLAGQHSIAPAGPGDPGFFGGRWMVYAATYTSAGLAYFNDGTGHVNQQLTSYSQFQWAINAGYITVTPTSKLFVCTLVPEN